MGIRLSDGQKVAFVGDPYDGHQIGDEGLVIVAGLNGSHVRWTTGDKANQITLMANLDVAPQGRVIQDRPEREERAVTSHIHTAFDRGGGMGVVAALRRDGHLEEIFDGMTDQVEAHIASCLRQQPFMREVLSRFDDSEADEVLRAAMADLLDEMRGAL